MRNQLEFSLGPVIANTDLGVWQARDQILTPLLKSEVTAHLPFLKIPIRFSSLKWEHLPYDIFVYYCLLRYCESDIHLHCVIPLLFVNTKTINQHYVCGMFSSSLPLLLSPPHTAVGFQGEAHSPSRNMWAIGSKLLQESFPSSSHQTQRDSKKVLWLITNKS